MKESDINIDIRNEYAKSPITIILYPDRVKKEFRHLSALYNFFDGEVAFWNRIIEDNKMSHSNQIRLIIVIRSQVANVMQLLHNICSFTSLSPQLLRELQEIRRLLSLGGEQKIIYRTSNTVTKLAEICASGRYDDNFVNSFVFYLQNGGFKDITFQGQLSAYLAQNPLSDPLHNLEIKKHLEEMIGQIQSVLETTEHEQSEYWDTVKADYENVTTNLSSKYDDLFRQRQQAQKDQSASWAKNLDEAKTRMAELEGLYREKLRLEAPAKYWSKLEREYEEKGNKWVRWAVGSTLVLGMILTSILYLTPESLKGSLTNLDSVTIRSTLILTVIVSTAIYLIRLFVKLATSAFHLARDAKERHTLANLYLSLSNEVKSCDKDREIILQSLFSRADSGLLKGDSSPAFPEGLSSVIMKNLK